MRMNLRMLIALALAAVMASVVSLPARAGNIVDEWASVKAPLPAVKKLLDEARAAKATVIYSYYGKNTAADIVDKSLAPMAGEGAVTSFADKFINTDLAKMLKDKGIKTLIVVGTAANGAVLCTGTDAALKGYHVVLPVDGISSADLYSEQFSVWQLAHGPTFGQRVTLTKVDMVKF
jgi:nicotinamidase-related amidase